MPFESNHFSLVVFDPPHLINGSMKSVINKKYGLLPKESWKQYILDGLNECYRVLAINGTMIFKWNEANNKVDDILNEFPITPLFGDFTGKTGKTRWMTFIKF